jgi:uncharacterized phiE125 gp8 family phage protein
MPLNLITAPTQACIGLAQAKLHLRVSHDEEDTLIADMLATATLEAEHLMQRAVMPQSWRLTLPAWPSQAGPVQLRMPPVRSIILVQSADANTGDMTTLVNAYRLAKGTEQYSLLLPAFGTNWPTAADVPDAVQVTFECGYANAAEVPAPIKQWLLLRLGGYYENREAWTSGAKIERNEHVDRLLDRYSAPTL